MSANVRPGAPPLPAREIGQARRRPSRAAVRRRGPQFGMMLSQALSITGTAPAKKPA